MSPDNTQTAIVVTGLVLAALFFSLGLVHCNRANNETIRACIEKTGDPAACAVIERQTGTR